MKENNLINVVIAIAPVNFIKDNFSILKYGDDFFLGYINYSPNKKKETEIFNKRGYRYSNFNISNEEDIKTLRKINYYKKKLNKKINLVLNNVGILSNTENLKKEIDFILDTIEIDRFIVADLFLLSFLNKEYPDIGINLSSLALLSNSYHINILKDFPNIKRIIFHRDIDEDTIINLIKKVNLMKLDRKIEYELFAINEWCYNIDGQCFSLHNVDKNIPFVCQRNGLYGNELISKYTKERSNCQLCLLKNIEKKSENKLNIFNYITYFKIPGRGHSSKVLKVYSKITKNIVFFLQQNKSLGYDIKKEIFYKNSNGLIGKSLVENMYCGNCFYKNN